ncbi:hypothetical protein SASPL_122045 [Salvia splendens]|uniref:Uncharacterized protein n=1 Tax=Salvia splendens TaxID=180675 RepID=A0A8X8ZRP8_SALSN|nr:hypothetical protein SASPL_122045 [Salvia splendens]
MPNGVSHPLRMVASVAASLLGGVFAAGFLSSSVFERYTSFKKVKTSAAQGIMFSYYVHLWLFNVGSNAVLTAWDTALHKFSISWC